jgi:dolichol-phosphate mannosyltransferase
MPLLTVIIPTINESRTIVPLIKQIRDTVDTPMIIVVDDGSTDDTPRIAEEEGAVCIRRPCRMGIISAFTDALKIVNTPYVALMDADLQQPPCVLNAMMKEANESTVIVGSRYVSGGSVENFPFGRTIISRVAIFLCHLFVPCTRRVKDATSGFLIMPLSVARLVDFSDPIGWKLVPYILKSCPYVRVIEIGYCFRGRSGKGSKLEVRTMIHYFVSLIKLGL